MSLDYLLTYLLIINILSFILAATDKLLAIKNKRRISEKTLFFMALLGGALFMFLSMRLFRHKTLHKRFMFGLPIIMVGQAIILICLQNKGIFY